MYKDPEKQKKASKEAMRRRRAKLKGITPNVIPVIPEPDVIPKIDHHLEQIGLERRRIELALLEQDAYMEGKPKAIDPDVQVIWDRRNAQGQAAGYSHNAQPEDYPQIQRPMI